MKTRVLSGSVLVSMTLACVSLSSAGCGGSSHGSIGPQKLDIGYYDTTREKKSSKQSVQRESPPSSGVSKESPFPQVTRTKLASGLTVAAIEAHALPLVQVRVLVHAGMGYGTQGAAEVTADMLKDGGTRTMTSADLLNRVETLGADLGVRVDSDASVFSIAVPTKALPQALVLLGEVIAEPRFDEGELRKLKARLTDDALENMRSDGSWMVRRAMFHDLYPSASPYATYDLLPSEIAKVTGNDIRDFHKRFYVSKNITVVLAGDVDAKNAGALVEKSFGAVKTGDAPKIDLSSANVQPAEPKRHVVVVDRPGSVQSDIGVCGLAPLRNSPAYPSARVAVQVLGGGVASRLFLDVREQRSLAYRTGAQIIEVAGSAEPLVLFAGTQTDKTTQAVEGILENAKKMADGTVSDPEAESARRYLSDIFAIRMETLGAIADLVVTADTLGLPDGYWDAYRSGLRDIDAARANDAGKKLFSRPFMVVVAGDANAIAAPLARFGEVTVLDPEHEMKFVKTIPEQK